MVVRALRPGEWLSFSVSLLVSSVLTGVDISREEEEECPRELGNKTEYLPLKSSISSGTWTKVTVVLCGNMICRHGGRPVAGQ